jgi:hypothetical protein
MALDGGCREAPRHHESHALPLHRRGIAARLSLRASDPSAAEEVGAFIQRSRIEPGTLEHLYPESTSATSDTA